MAQWNIQFKIGHLVLLIMSLWVTQNSSTVNPQDKVRIANCLTYLVPVKIIIFSALAVLYIPVAYMRSRTISNMIIVLNFQIDDSKLYFSMH